MFLPQDEGLLEFRLPLIVLDNVLLPTLINMYHLIYSKGNLVFRPLLFFLLVRLLTAAVLKCASFTFDSECYRVLPGEICSTL